jgi:hypothetical protein
MKIKRIPRRVFEFPEEELHISSPEESVKFFQK